MHPADLELGLHRRDGESYVAELRFTRPGNDWRLSTPHAPPG